MKIIKSISSLVVLILVTLSFNVFAQRTRTSPTKKIIKPSSANTQTKTEANKCIYSDKEIELNIERLPQKFLGNDPTALALGVITKTKIVKDEFETTAQFLARRENERKKTITGSLTFNSLLAFSDAEGQAFRYDADQKRLYIRLKLLPTLSLATTCEPDVLTKFNSFLRPGDDFVSYYEIDQRFDLNIEEARNLKPNLRTLYIGQLSDIFGAYYATPNNWDTSIAKYLQKVSEVKKTRDESKRMFDSASADYERTRRLYESGDISIYRVNATKSLLDSAREILAVAEDLLVIVKKRFLLLMESNPLPDVKPAPILSLKEIWFYDISTGKILTKHRINIDTKVDLPTTMPQPLATPKPMATPPRRVGE